MIKGHSGLKYERQSKKLVPTLPPDTVKCIRISLGLSPEELADKIAITGRTVYAWEAPLETNSRSCTGPARLLLLQLAGALDEEDLPEDHREMWTDSEEEPWLINEHILRAELEAAKEAEDPERVEKAEEHLDRALSLMEETREAA